MVNYLEDYDLELDRIVASIKVKGYKLVMIHLPDGLKPKAKDIVDHIEKGTNASVIIWMGSCYGACDMPQEIAQLGIDLFVQFGHSTFHKTRGW
jgi:diphthamide biosynthesis enzyme Dph1/Dph2-like protein